MHVLSVEDDHHKFYHCKNTHFKLKMLIFKINFIFYYYYQLICPTVFKGVFLFYQRCLRSYRIFGKVWDADIFSFQILVVPTSDKNLIFKEVPTDEIFVSPLTMTLGVTCSKDGKRKKKCSYNLPIRDKDNVGATPWQRGNCSVSETSVYQVKHFQYLHTCTI